MTITPSPEAVHQYFDRRRRPREPDKGFAADERQFNDALWRAFCLGRPLPADHDLTRIVEMLRNGVGIRATARAVGTGNETVSRVRREMAADQYFVDFRAGYDLDCRSQN